MKVPILIKDVLSSISSSLICEVKKDGMVDENYRE